MDYYGLVLRSMVWPGFLHIVAIKYRLIEENALNCTVCKPFSVTGGELEQEGCNY